MKSYTTLRNLYGSWTNDTNGFNLTLGDQMINDSYRRIIASQDWHFMHKVGSATTITQTPQYNLPYDYEKLNAVTVTVGSQTYVPKEMPSERFWLKLNSTTVYSDTPEWYIIVAGQIFLWPIPATSSNTIGFYYKKSVKDLSIADYTTGGVLTATTSSTAIVGTGTTWTPAMAGRFLRITDSDTANKGDGFWYPIASSASATTITLSKVYGGTLITAGNAAYTIGQMPLLPEEFHDLPVYEAVGNYFMKEGDFAQGDRFEKKFQQRLADLRREHGNRSTNVVVDSGQDYTMQNPNLYIRL